MRTKKANTPDWPAIKADYENTNKSIRAIAKWFRISDTAIRKKAKADEWKRPELEKFAREPATEPAIPVPPLTAAAAVDPEAIVTRGRNLISSLIEELEAIGQPPILNMIKQEILNETAVDLNSRRRNIMLKAVAFPTRAAAIKNLATALRSLLGPAEPAGAGGKKEKQKAAAGQVGAGGDGEWGDLLTPGSAPN